MYGYNDIIFAHPKFLWLMLMLPLLAAWYLFVSSRRRATLQVSSIGGLTGVKKGLRYYLQHLPFALCCAALACIFLALARPQSTTKSESIYTEGIDIVLALDISGSMLAHDFTPDRLQAAREIFYKQQPYHLININDL